MNDFIKEFKSKIPIADVIGEYVRLKKTGTNLMGLCPFHNERSPSFSVSMNKGIYHCFGCQKSGDVIAFVQEMQAVSFHEAIRLLAHKFGLELPPEFSRKGPAGAVSPDQRNEIYYKLNHFVTTFYHQKLLSSEGKIAREYFSSRGISEDTIKKESLGYAPAEWAELYDFLVSKKAPLEKAEELGLIRRKSDASANTPGRTHYDFFRHRVMFPVLDLRGRVIAFGARKLGDEEGPKYLNSSESPIFKKGSGFYGLFRAQKDIRAEDICVVVEGFMDCLSLQQAGVPYAVATLGTALGGPQVKLLNRLTSNVVVVFDGDSAGQQAQAKAMETFLGEGVVVRGVSMPDELDPDEFVKERGVDAFHELVKSAPYLLDQRILELASNTGGHPEAKTRAVDQILPWISKLTSDNAKFVRVQQIAGLFGLDANSLGRRVGIGAKAPIIFAGLRPGVRQNQDVSVKQNIEPVELRFLELLVLSPRVANDFTEESRCFEGFQSEEAKNLAARLLTQARSLQSFGGEILEWSNNSEIKQILARAIVTVEEEQGKEKSTLKLDEIAREFKDLSAKLVRRGMERKRDTLRVLIDKAEGAGQTAELARLMSEYRELVKSLGAVAAQ